jgi:hypothetical protein
MQQHLTSLKNLVSRKSKRDCPLASTHALLPQLNAGSKIALIVNRVGAIAGQTFMSNARFHNDDPFKNFDKIFFLVGLGVLTIFNLIGWPFVLLATVKSLTCERIEPSQHGCVLNVQQGPLGWEKTIQTFPISELQKAVVEESPSSPGLYRVVILTERGELHLMSGFTLGQDNKTALANQVNRFVKNKQETRLQVQQDERWGSYFIGGLFLVIGNLIGFVFIFISISLRQNL